MHIDTKPGTERPRISRRYKSLPVLRLIFFIPVMSMPRLIPSPRHPSFTPLLPTPTGKKIFFFPASQKIAASRIRRALPKVTGKTQLSPPSTPSNKGGSGLSLKLFEPSSPS